MKKSRQRFSISKCKCWALQLYLQKMWHQKTMQLQSRVRTYYAWRLNGNIHCTWKGICVCHSCSPFAQCIWSKAWLSCHRMVGPFKIPWGFSRGLWFMALQESWILLYMSKDLIWVGNSGDFNLTTPRRQYHTVIQYHTLPRGRCNLSATLLMRVTRADRCDFQ